MVEIEPALQVDGVPAGNQTSILENSEFNRSIAGRRDDLMERVL